MIPILRNWHFSKHFSKGTWKQCMFIAKMYNWLSLLDSHQSSPNSAISYLIGQRGCMVRWKILKDADQPKLDWPSIKVWTAQFWRRHWFHCKIYPKFKFHQYGVFLDSSVPQWFWHQNFTWIFRQLCDSFQITTCSNSWSRKAPQYCYLCTFW